MAGLYIHIPFCRSRCIYCAFFSTTRLERRQHYVDALCREMELRAHDLGDCSVDTVYIGGGTPSMLTAAQLATLLQHAFSHFQVSPHAEITLECNPDDVTDDLLATLPVNRVSMGAQTFSDERLRFLRRRHSAVQVGQAVSCLRRHGIGNISIDLMYGFPGETLAQWQTDIEAALALQVEHLSAYALSYEEGTPLHAMLQQGRVEELSDDLQRDMYYALKDRLETAGYEHYELSNFARPGFSSRHNSGYWDGTPYIGLGAGAHSYDGTRRQWNVADLDAYLGAIAEGRVPAEGEQLDDITRYNEQVMTRLRTRRGFPLQLLSAAERSYCLRQARRYLDCGWLVLQGADTLVLARQGLFVSDMVMSDLMMLPT